MDLPPTVPVPERRPTIGSGAENVEQPSEQPETETEAPTEADPKRAGEANQDSGPLPTDPALSIDTEDPAGFAACTAELTAIGAQFALLERIDDGNGCGIDRPLELRTLGNGVTLSPPGTMRCATAVNLARWTRDVVVPMLRKSQPAERLSAVDQASAYVCRKRNGADTGKISEHARGTAIDIAGFTFASGRTFKIQPREQEPTLNGAFQRAIASAACLYFSTVLDPGSDAAHETHLHLDTLIRKGGYRYCW